MSSDMHKILKKLERLERYMSRKLPRIIGIEAVNFFSESFHKQGFTDKSFKPWKKAKRTDAQSPWYGFEYRAKTPLPDNHPRRRNAKRPYKPRKPNPVTNFSPAATKRPTLTGQTGNLGESIQYRVISPQKVVIFSDLPYAKVHNEGGTIIIFGKKQVKLPKRQFIGPSEKLAEKLAKEIEKDIMKILK